MRFLRRIREEIAYVLSFLDRKFWHRDFEVECLECGVELGYMAHGGPAFWLCAACSPTGRVSDVAPYFAL